jgi:hypothetical protein
MLSSSASVSVTPAGTFSAPVWSLIGPVKMCSEPSIWPVRTASAAALTSSVTLGP